MRRQTIASAGHDAVEVVVSDDRMRASIRVDPSRAPGGVELDDVLAALDAAGIDGVDRSRVLSLADARGRVVCPGPVVVAEGVAASPGTGAQWELTLPAEKWGAVEAGDVLGSWRAGTPGVDGRDVCGRRLRAEVVPERHRLGSGVCIDESGAVRAMGAGRLVVYPDGTISVLAVRRVQGDLNRWAGVGRDSGAAREASGGRDGLEVEGDLEVTGSVSGAGVLAVGGALRVQGAVEARRVECGEDLQACGGLLGGGAVGVGAVGGERTATERTATERTATERTGGSVYVAGRDVRCRFATSCRIEAGGGVCVKSDLMHCEVLCGGRLEVGERVQGCVVVATGGVVCRSVGNTARRVTVLKAGTDPTLREMAAAVLPGLEGALQRMEHGRLTIRPLLERRRLLTPGQREQAGRLMDETARVERELMSATAALRERYRWWQAAAADEVQVLDVLSAGVVLRFPGIEATVMESLRGPVKLRPDHSPGEPRVVATDLRTGAVTFLPARMLTDPVTAQLRKVMAKLAA
ncbi:MAG: FapA family protein [Tepidisphaerales bacterium]